MEIFLIPKRAGQSTLFAARFSRLVRALPQPIRMHQLLPQAEIPPINSATTRFPRIGILVVAYNAVSTLAQVLDRIPKAFRARINHVFVCDDASRDPVPSLVGLGYQQITDDLPLTIIRHPTNLGYGGNQKMGYRLAVEHGLDIIVLLHGDGQYAPECLEDIVAPLEREECEAVLGSRMMIKGAARRGRHAVLQVCRQQDPDAL